MPNDGQVESEKERIRAVVAAREREAAKRKADMDLRAKRRVREAAKDAEVSDKGEV